MNEGREVKRAGRGGGREGGGDGDGKNKRNKGGEKLRREPSVVGLLCFVCVCFFFLLNADDSHSGKVIYVCMIP